MLEDLPEELLPLEEEDSTTTSLDTAILNYPYIKFMQKCFHNSTIPILILDTRLRILWHNKSYNKLPGKIKDQTGQYLPDTFNPRIDKNKIDYIHASLKSETTGFSWRGRVEASHKDFLTAQVNMMITPIIDPNNISQVLIGYFAFFDDVTEESRSMIKDTFSGLLGASILKDNDTGQHVKRVGEYSHTMAKKLFNCSLYSEIDREFVSNINFLAAMHDVGKIGTPDDILNKTGRFEAWEFEIMREHTINGAYILSSYPVPMAKQIALFHHEWWDGSGYPYKVSENMIPLSARIVAIADVYDALRMKRSYKRAFSHEETCIEIEKEAGTHFDPELAKCFIDLEKLFSEIYTRLEDKNNQTGQKISFSFPDL